MQGPMVVHSQQQQHQQLYHMVPAITSVVDAGCGGDGNQVATLFQPIVLPTVFSEPESELTCNRSGARKRARDDGPPSSNILYYHQQRQFLLQKQLVHDALPVDSSRPNQSSMASTSGRQILLAPQPSVASPGNSNANINIPPGSVSFSSGLTSMLHRQGLEMDALIRLHTENLRSGLDEARKRQCRAVVTALGKQAERVVVEKQAELLAATNKNAELEDRLRQAAAESQAWFHAARNSESLVARLRASLQQALLQKLNGGNNSTNDKSDRAPPEDLSSLAETKEGYGDSEEEAAPAPEAVSPSAPGSAHCTEANKTLKGEGRFFPCKTCDQDDACVLVLPCRHLCLCPSCEPSVNECPVCGHRKNASLQINLA